MLYGLPPYTLCFKLYPNKLKNASSNFVAVSEPKGTIGIKDFYDLMQHYGLNGFLHSEGQLELVLKAVMETAVEAALEGYDVDLCGMLRLRVTINGGFDSEGAEFDPGKNKVGFAVNTGDAFKRMLHKALLDRDVGFANDTRECGTPTIRSVSDATGQAEDEKTHEVPPGRLNYAYGYRLMTDFKDERQGVFLIAADGKRARVQGSNVNHNRLVFRVPPDTPRGTYTLAVRNGPTDVFPLDDSMIGEGRFYPLRVTDTPVPDEEPSHPHHYKNPARVMVKGNGRWRRCRVAQRRR